MDWPPQPLHSCASGTDTYVKGPIIFVGVADVTVVLAERKLTSYVYAVGGSKLLQPDLEQHSTGHSIRGKYNSAYSIC
ncbi:hypothetical protein TIFTF001_041439 [Ficus carica]|uniref:Uncharacterized protein n=1 Tax=Ficus carica TaxID=3494 RepID=A0AA87ZPG0_FICCA|nr:hypothetical protein TIFTF001_041439 [Ficus carica]